MNKSDLTVKKLKSGLLKEQSTDQLAATIDQLDQFYSSFKKDYKMMSGLVLLEARSRFPSDELFGKWVDEHFVSDKKSGTNKNDSRSDPNSADSKDRYRAMNFARYFVDKDYSKIGLSVCYIIAAPQNSDIADQLYNWCLEDKRSVQDVKEYIDELRYVEPEPQPQAEKAEKQKADPKEDEPQPRWKKEGWQAPPGMDEKMNEWKRKSGFDQAFGGSAGNEPSLKEAELYLQIDKVYKDMVDWRFKQMAHKCHPDREGGSEEEFKKLTAMRDKIYEAYGFGGSSE